MVNEIQIHPVLSKKALQSIVDGFSNQSDGVKDASQYVTQQASSGLVRTVASALPMVSALLPESVITGASNGLASMTQQVVENTPQGRESLSWLNRTWQDIVLWISSAVNKESKLKDVVGRYSQDNSALDKPLHEIAQNFNTAQGKNIITAAVLKDAVTAGMSDNIGLFSAFSTKKPEDLAQRVYDRTLQYTAAQIIQKLPADQRDDRDAVMNAYMQAEMVAAAVSGVRAVDTSNDKKPLYAPVLDSNGKTTGTLAYFTESFAGKQPQAFAVVMPKEETSAPVVKPDSQTVARSASQGAKPETPLHGGGSVPVGGSLGRPSVPENPPREVIETAAR